MDKTKFDRMCLEGCPNYHHKWSCPPYSPDFERFASIWDNLYIVFMHTDLSQFSYIQNDYLKVKAANSILKSRADRYTRSMAKKHGNYISTGSCRLCKPCKCKIGELCAHPEIMTYSYEALGIDVGQLVEEYFHKPLMWYKRDCLPQYTSVVSGILTNEELDDEYLRYCYQMSIGIS
jgi:predicted metal-binding protein